MAKSKTPPRPSKYASKAVKDAWEAQYGEGAKKTVVEAEAVNDTQAAVEETLQRAGETPEDAARMAAEAVNTPDEEGELPENPSGGSGGASTATTDSDGSNESVDTGSNAQDATSPVDTGLVFTETPDPTTASDEEHECMLQAIDNMETTDPDYQRTSDWLDAYDAAHGGSQSSAENDRWDPPAGPDRGKIEIPSVVPVDALEEAERLTASMSSSTKTISALPEELADMVQVEVPPMIKPAEPVSDSVQDAALQAVHSYLKNMSHDMPPGVRVQIDRNNNSQADIDAGRLNITLHISDPWLAARLMEAWDSAGVDYEARPAAPARRVALRHYTTRTGQNQTLGGIPVSGNGIGIKLPPEDHRLTGFIGSHLDVKDIFEDEL
jgi:hypothetical protein